MRLLTASALSLLARCRSGETPLFMRLITTSPDRIGFWHAGRHARVGFGTDLGALASGPVSRPEVGELSGVEHVGPAAPASVPVLPPHDPERVRSPAGRRGLFTQPHPGRPRSAARRSVRASAGPAAHRGGLQAEPCHRRRGTGTSGSVRPRRTTLLVRRHETSKRARPCAATASGAVTERRAIYRGSGGLGARAPARADAARFAARSRNTP